MDNKNKHINANNSNIDRVESISWTEMSIKEAEELLKKSVAHKIIDLESEDYLALLSDDNRVAVLSLPTEGSSYEIAERMISAIDSLGNKSKNVFYALEVENKWALAPDHSVISQMMDEHYNVKREIVGTTSNEPTEEFSMYLQYSNVIVGLIL